MRMSKSKKYIAGLLLLLFFGAAFIHGAQLLSMGTAYKAKMLCSEIFVAGRDQEDVLSDLIVDDLSVLKIIDSFVDRKEKNVTSSFYGIGKSKVQYRDNGGCAVVSDTSYSTSKPKKSIDHDIPARSLVRLEDFNEAKLYDVVDEAFSEPDPDHLRRTRAVVILHKGQIIAERYSYNIDKDTPLLGWSMTKSVMNALAGILVQDGRLALDTPIGSVIWSELDDPRQTITVRHLLNMTSGLKFNEEMSDPLADVSRMLLQEPDMAAFAASMPLEVKPGSRWQYSSGNTILLSEYIRQLLGDDEYHLLPKNALFDRLQMRHAILETDASGTFVGSSFMYATARDWAKLGLLYIKEGVWEGERIFPEGWLQYTLKPESSNPEKNYGAHFWLKIPNEYRGNEGITLPENTFHAIGHEGQFITVVPSHDTVIVRFGKTRYSGAWKHDTFVKDVLSALLAGKQVDLSP